jgi:hypothetical protein
VTENRRADRGEILAARMNEEIARLHLSGVLAAEYVPGLERVRVRHRDDDVDAFDYPVSYLWSERAIEDLRLFAELRRQNR